MATCHLSAGRVSRICERMILWTVLALMTGAAVLCVLWPLSARAVAARDERGDVSFYEDQLREISRDGERGLISAAEADAARAEAGRRLLRANAVEPAPAATTGEPALRRRRAAAAFALSAVPLIGLTVYGALGSPQAAIQPAAPQTAAAGPDIETALAQMEAHLASHPDDARGWDVVAPIYLRLGRFDEASRAYAAARRSGGETAERLTGAGEALVGSGAGIVSAEAAAAFRRAVEIDPASAKGRFYLALAVEQDGDLARARTAYEALLASGGPNAPWRPLVETRLARLSGQGATAPALATGEGGPDIQAMVRRLDERLAAGGGSEPEWSRLVRSYAVLGQRDEAVRRLGLARTALGRDPEAGTRLDRLAQDLGLEEAAK